MLAQIKSTKVGKSRVRRKGRIFLNVFQKSSMKLIKERNKNSHRSYLGNKKAKKVDVHEKNVKFLENSRKSALWLAKTQKGWIKIDCAKDGAIDTRENIHKENYAKVKKLIK